MHELPSRVRLRAHNLSLLLIYTLNRTQGSVELLAGGHVGDTAPDMQAVQLPAQSGFVAREDLGPVDVDGEGVDGGTWKR